MTSIQVAFVILVLERFEILDHCIHLSRNRYKVKLPSLLQLLHQSQLQQISAYWTLKRERVRFANRFEFYRRRYFSEASEKENNDNIDQYLNIDNLPGGLQVKVVFKTESENVLVRTPRDETTKCLVRQVCDKNWHAAANSIAKHSELFPEVLKAVNKNASNEMSEYLKSESMLLSNKPDEITGFSNTIFLEELRIFCPVVYHFVLSACGIQESDVKVKGTAANGVALATAVMCRLRNPKASALHYRISTVLFHSGAKHDDLVRLNRLGVSMSPKQIVRAQSEMGKQLEGKVNVWKSQIEERKGAELLLEEIKMKQVPDSVETDMEIITEVQVDKNTVLGYNNFTPQGHEYLLREIEVAKQRKGESTCTNEILSDVESGLANSRLPLYRQGLRNI